LIPDHPLNRRITAKTPIPLISERAIAGSRTAIGTLANCAGGITPWGSFLSCEENFQHHYGDRAFDPELPPETGPIVPGRYNWTQFYRNPPEHYGWVVEINPLRGDAKKLTALGRFCHESATVTQAKDGRCVVYSGDDAHDECLYKFIAERPGSLEKGKLYVASLEQGKWLSLDWNEQLVLKETFRDPTETLIHTRVAARKVGGTALDRPEDIAISPHDQSLLIALTGNKPRGNYFGSILKIKEKNSDPLSLEFESETFLTGGETTGFACPDNVTFDPQGGFWFTSDISGRDLNREPYQAFKNNGLYYVPMKGARAGEVIQVASGPVDSELTGPMFTPDGKTLFLAVQHPGEQSESLEKLTSHWPDGGQNLPRSAVVAIYGSALEKLCSPLL
jgi:uncharacterized protein